MEAMAIWAMINFITAAVTAICSVFAYHISKRVHRDATALREERRRELAHATRLLEDAQHKWDEACAASTQARKILDRAHQSSLN